jgi:hypothetical protein
MAEDGRVNELRRPLHENQASIAFAPLAESLRLAGRQMKAVSICRADLSIYPEYVAARITLARALLELQRLEEAEREFEHTRSLSPGYLPAIRALAGIDQRCAIDVDAFRRAALTTEALESWLVAIYVARAGRGA